jgi:hypothetical protein
MPEMDCPQNQLLDQNLMQSPLPISHRTEALKKALVTMSSSIGMADQGRSGATQCSHNHLTLRAMPMDYKSSTPKPPKHSGRGTFGQSYEAFSCLNYDRVGPQKHLHYLIHCFANTGWNLDADHHVD